MDLFLTTRYLDDLTALGVTVPKASQNACDIYRAAMAAAARQPTDGLRKALDAGEVTAENVAEMVYKAAADQTAQQNAATIVRDLHLVLNRRINDALRADHDRIVSELRNLFRPHAAAVADAAKHFGPDTTADEVVTMRADAIKAWKAVTAHTNTLDAIAAAYQRLLSDLTGTLPEHIVSLYVTGTTDLDQAAEVYRQRNKWLALAAAGFTLRLNSTTEAATVVAKADQAKAEKAAAEREVMLAAHRKRHMPIGIERIDRGVFR